MLVRVVSKRFGNKHAAETAGNIDDLNGKNGEKQIVVRG